MHIPHTQFEPFLREKFPYPVQMYDHYPEEFARINRLARKWQTAYVVLGILFMIAYGIVLMYTLLWVNDMIYKSLRGTENWFSQREAAFAIAALFLSFPLGIVSAAKAIRLFHPWNDYLYIIDLLNLYTKYDLINGWLWMLRPLGMCAAIAFAVGGWSYVHVTDSGFTVKRAMSVEPIRYSFTDVRSITHYRYQHSEGKTEPNDHYDLQLNNGQHFIDIAAYVSWNDCLKRIATVGHIPVAEVSVDTL